MLGEKREMAALYHCPFVSWLKQTSDTDLLYPDMVSLIDAAGCRLLQKVLVLYRAAGRHSSQQTTTILRTTQFPKMESAKTPKNDTAPGHFFREFCLF